MSPLRFGVEQARSASISDVESNDEVVFYGRQAGRPAVFNDGVESSKLVEQASKHSHNLPATRSRNENGRLRPTNIPEKFGVNHRPQGSTKDAAIDDYVSNLASDEHDLEILQNMFSNLRDLGGSDHLPSGSEDSGEFVHKMAGNTHELLHTAGSSGTSEAYAKQSTRVIERRIRRKKVQYLILKPGSTSADAEWLPKEQIVKSGLLIVAVKNFEASRLSDQIAYSPDISEGITPDEDEIGFDLKAAIEDLEEEDAQAADRMVSMDGEQFARLTAKQKQLGIDSPDLILFDDGGVESSWRGMTRDGLNRTDLFAEPCQKRKGRAAIDKSIPQGLINTDHIAKDVGMNARFKKKSRKSPGPNIGLDLSDSDMVEHLRTGREKDRSTKRAKKREREELRSQGLLGKHGQGDVDLKAKYAAGMRMEDIKTEIKLFMNGPKQSISLPNMDPQARKTVHEICHKLGLKSKSMGSGVARFPILYKTSRTRTFNENAFGQMRRKFFGAPGRPNKLIGPVGRAKLSRNVSHGQYHDGEIVGASAPELGQENRGRAMLEKMGWSKGTNLGATDNPGIAEPVAQVVKRTRAGLG